MENMKVVLIGASGLLGHNVLLRLLGEGYEVRVLVRRPDAVRLPQGNWQTVVGNPTDRSTLLAAAEGCQALVNCAGVTDMSLLRYDDYLSVNRDLCGLLVEAMEHWGIDTLIHTSTVNTIGYGSPARPADEQVPMQAPFLQSGYASSKREGEELLMAAARRHTDWHLVIINPGFMLGAWDVKPSSGRLLQLAYRHAVAFAPKGGKAFVHVEDVAEAEVNALTRGRNGERYIVVNDNGCFSIKQLYRMQARVMGYRQWVMEIPQWLWRLIGRVGDLLRTMGVQVEASTCNIRQMMVHEHYTRRKADEELGGTVRTIEQAIVDFHKWREKEQ